LASSNFLMRIKVQIFQENFSTTRIKSPIFDFLSAVCQEGKKKKLSSLKFKKVAVSMGKEKKVRTIGGLSISRITNGFGKGRTGEKEKEGN